VIPALQFRPLLSSALIRLVVLFLAGCTIAFAQRDQTALDSTPTLKFPQFSGARTIHMVAYGDCRFTDPSTTTGTNPRVRKWLVEQIAREHPQVLLMTGDTPYTGAKSADWQVFDDETAPWREENILQLPTTGNHEEYGGKEQGIKNYLDHFPAIERHRFYSALLGNVEVISLDLTGDLNSGGVQARWFASQLEHVPATVDFLLILYHKPWMADEQSNLFVNLPSPQELMFRGVLEAHLNRLHAKVVVFNGHIHNYERFERNGVEYVVTGGGGAEPYPILLRGSADLYRDTGFPVYNYLIVDITGRELHATMWKVKDPAADHLSVEAKDDFVVAAPERHSPGKTGSKVQGQPATTH
jgi:calcineurin-like phosphoesterase family protein